MPELTRVSPWPEKLEVFGTKISRTSLDEIMPLLEERNPERAITISVCNVHSLMSARNDADLSAALAATEISTADGMPLVWVMRSLGCTEQTRVKGSELTLMALRYGVSRGWRHFFYGSTPETLAKLSSTLRDVLPGVQISGMLAPPFRPLTEAEQRVVIETIIDAKTDIVWVGLGMPKQEKWMHEVRAQLPSTVMVGIGAAFDFIAGTKLEAPRWLQDAGLEWAFRFATEPRRLWRRYIWNNPAFLVLWLKTLATRRWR